MQKKDFDSATHFMHQEVLQEQEQKKIVDSAVLDEVLVQQHAKFLENQGHGSRQTVVSHTMQAPLEKKIFDSADHFLSIAEQERLREQLDIESKEDEKATPYITQWNIQDDHTNTEHIQSVYPFLDVCSKLITDIV